jgi:predicted nucleic acid-binding protein
VTNALHRYHRAGYLRSVSAEIALDAALALAISLEDSHSVHIAALRLAAALGLPATCGAHYLALADQLGAELWTGDAKLVRELDGRGPRIRLLGETGS